MFFSCSQLFNCFGELSSIGDSCSIVVGEGVGKMCFGAGVDQGVLTFVDDVEIIVGVCGAGSLCLFVGEGVGNMCAGTCAAQGALLVFVVGVGELSGAVTLWSR